MDAKILRELRAFPGDLCGCKVSFVSLVVSF